MSKKFNYSKQYNKPVQEPGVDTPQTPVQEQPPVIRKGVVSGCDRLNVRKGCSKDTDVISVITKGTIVDIHGETPEGDWYEIATANGKINGYCMSEFIELR